MKSTQQGVGMIEILVALLLLAVSILGFSAMQMKAVKATGESIDRTQAIGIMRSAAEKIRINSSAITNYQSNFASLSSNITSNTAMTIPTKRCGLGATSTSCTPSEIASSDVYDFYLQTKSAGFNLNMVTCPGTGLTTASSVTVPTDIMLSYCLIAAWNKTTPTKGSDPEVDCITDIKIDKNNNLSSSGGNYYPKATCMFMEIS